MTWKKRQKLRDLFAPLLVVRPTFAEPRSIGLTMPYIAVGVVYKDRRYHEETEAETVWALPEHREVRIR